MMPNLPRVLLLAGYPPEGGGGGGVILRSLLDGFPADRLMWLTTEADVSLTWKWRPEISRRSVTRRIRAKKFRLVRKAWEAGLYLWEGWQALSLARRIREEWRPEAVWAVLDHRNLWAVYEIVMALKLPWHVSVHDDPEIARRLTGSKLPHTWQRRFDYLYSQAQSRDCVSGGMAELYRERYNVSAFQACRTIDPIKLLEARKRPILRGDTIQIVMGGWADCPPPWPENLLEALALVRRDTGRNVCLNAFDPCLRPHEGSPEGSMLKLHPRMPEAQFNQLLERMDLGYAPDPLTEDGRRFAQTSLSTKLVTYIGATLPSLYHGPGRSTAAEMFSRHRAGEVVDSQCPNDIASGFLKLINGAEEYRDHAVHLATSDFDPGKLSSRILSRF